jgi:DNA-binding transcriptional MerR regulator
VTTAAPPASAADPLGTLREYSALAPWRLRDLVALASAILDASGIFPVNAAARARPTERTIRFYVTRGLVSPPEGRGTAAIYGYRHLLQVLAIKLRQMEGATLETIVKELAGLAGDVVERRVAGALGAALPAPSRLTLALGPGGPSGKVGRALQGRLQRVTRAGEGASRDPAGQICRRVPLAPGVELLVDERHPLFHRATHDSALVAQFRHALAGLLPEGEEEPRGSPSHP